jgi:hypothetical protein
VKLDSENRNYCMWIDQEIIGGKNFNLKFNFAGQNEENIKAKIVEINDQHKRKILLTFGPGKGNYGSFKHDIDENFEYEVCFDSFDREEKIITFNYDIHHSEGYADKHDLHSTAQYLGELQDSIFEIQSLMEEVRGNEWAHHGFLRNNIKIIKWGALAKVGLLIMIAAVNLNLLINLLKKTQTKVSSLI